MIVMMGPTCYFESDDSYDDSYDGTNLLFLNLMIVMMGPTCYFESDDSYDGTNLLF